MLTCSAKESLQTILAPYLSMHRHPSSIASHHPVVLFPLSHLQVVSSSLSWLFWPLSSLVLWLIQLQRFSSSRFQVESFFLLLAPSEWVYSLELEIPLPKSLSDGRCFIRAWVSKSARSHRWLSWDTCRIGQPWNSASIFRHLWFSLNNKLAPMESLRVREILELMDLFSPKAPTQKWTSPFFQSYLVTSTLGIKIYS